jgi:hypothetical protein
MLPRLTVKKRNWHEPFDERGVVAEAGLVSARAITATVDRILLSGRMPPSFFNR